MHFVVDQFFRQPQALEAVAAGYEAEWPDWYLGGKGSARMDVLDRMRPEGLPIGFVALNEIAVVGAASLTTLGPVRPEIGPWVGGLWTHPDHRRQGVASALVRRCAAEAGRQGFAVVYAATSSAPELFERLGWGLRETVPYPGGDLAIYELAT